MPGKIRKPQEPRDIRQSGATGLSGAGRPRAYTRSVACF